MRTPQPADYYDQAYFDDPDSGKGYKSGYTATCAPWDAVARALVRTCNPRKVVEFGAAKGFVLQALARLGVEGVGYDWSEYAVSKAVADVRLADVTAEDFEPEQADLVIAMDLLEHCDRDGIARIMHAADLTGATLLYCHVGIPTPGAPHDDQADVGHVTVMPIEMWVEHVESFGWTLSDVATGKIRVFYRSLGALGRFWAERCFLCHREVYEPTEITPGPLTAKKAFLVLGPESSGTRLMTRILMQAGCIGQDGHKQRWDDHDPNEGLIVWRRSVPHGGEWPDVAGMAARLQGLGYETQAVVTSRSWYPMMQSQAKKHVGNEKRANSRMQAAYLWIFTGLREARVPFIVTSYEDLVLRKETALRRIMDMLELPTPSVHLYDANGKWYGELAEVRETE